MTFPAFLIAGTASGQGKTSVTAALARWQSRAGRRVKVFKCGPDFLDPMILARASGQPVDNMDLWMTGLDDARWRLQQAQATHDLVLIESVMGLHDGSPSSADLARALGLHVVVVIDASAMAQTFGALAQGLFAYAGGGKACVVPLGSGGVIANRVASTGHATMLRESLPVGIDWWGHLGRDLPSLPERHLGLVSAAEIPLLDTYLDAWADAVAVALAGSPLAVDVIASASLCGVASPDPMPPSLRGLRQILAGRRIALARDAAFCFIYPANVETLQALGAEVLPFSPLAGESIPAQADAMWLPGGYPELHGPALAASPWLAELPGWVEQGGHVWAECGGLMTLTEALVMLDGERVPMAGLLPGEARMQSRLAALGLQSLELPGGALRGHSFHFSIGDGLPTGRWQTVPQRWGHPEAVIERPLGRGVVRASYFHPWFASAPDAAASLFGELA